MVNFETWVIDYIKKYHQQTATRSSRLIEDLEMDSLDLVDLEMSLEEIVNLDTKSLDFKRIKTVGDLVNILESRFKKYGKV
jgi:acyl carrier protein